MAYRKYRRYTKSKQNKRFNKYANNKTDAKSQSKQIISLNRKINKVYNNTRPELKRLNVSATRAVEGIEPSVIAFETFIGDVPLKIFQGNYAKYVYFNYRIAFNLNGVDMTRGNTFRLIILQNKVPLTGPPSVEDILNVSVDDYKVISPFKDNITNKYKILLSKIYAMSADKDIVYKSYNFKKLINYKKASGDETKYPRGCIFSFVCVPKNQTSITYYYSTKLGYVDN